MARPIEAHFPPERYEYVPVVVFRTHQRVKNGQVVKVDRQKLERIANKHNALWERYARTSPISLGHTLDGDVPESVQPDVAGPTVRFHVEPAPDEEGEYFLCATWCRPKERREELSQYIALSPEYYPSKDWLYPISALKSSAPELPDMPAIPIQYGVTLEAGEEEPYRLVIDNPFHYSTTTTTESVMNPDEMKVDDKKPADDKPKSDKPEDKAKDEAEAKETKGAKTDKSELAEIKEMLAQLMPLVEAAPDLLQLVQLMKEEPVGPEGKEDLMQPTDKPEDKKPAPAEPLEKGPDNAPEKDKAFDTPVKFDSAMGSSTNANIPSFEKDKKGYAMSDEVLKYKKLEEDAAKYKAELDATKKIAQDLLKESRLAKAKEMVRELEEVHMIAYASDEVRQQDVKMLSELEPASAKQYVEMAKVRYQKKTPNSAAVAEVAKYAVEGEPDLNPKTPEEAHERAMKILASGLSRDEYLKKLAEGKAK